MIFLKDCSLGSNDMRPVMKPYATILHRTHFRRFPEWQPHILITLTVLMFFSSGGYVELAQTLSIVTMTPTQREWRQGLAPISVRNGKGA